MARRGLSLGVRSCQLNRSRNGRGSGCRARVSPANGVSPQLNLTQIKAIGAAAAKEIASREFEEYRREVQMAHSTIGRSADRRRVAGGQAYEVRYFARKHGITIEQAKELIKRVGNDREKLNAEAGQ